MSVDAYEILGVDEGVDERTLRSAYRARARLVHPDVNPDPAGQVRFAELSNAYRLLADPAERSRIDAQRARRSRFRADRPAPLPSRRPGGDVLASLAWTDQTPRHSQVHDVAVTSLVTCAGCAGSGSRGPRASLACTPCEGTGHRQHLQHTLEGEDLLTWRPCRECAATGAVPRDPCPDCGGDGRRRVDRSVRVELNADALPGSTFVVRGSGHAGRDGGSPGDLLITIAADHPTPDRDRGARA